MFMNISKMSPQNFKTKSLFILKWQHIFGRRYTLDFGARGRGRQYRYSLVRVREEEDLILPNVSKQENNY